MITITIDKEDADFIHQKSRFYVWPGMQIFLNRGEWVVLGQNGINFSLRVPRLTGTHAVTDYMKDKYPEYFI